MRTTRSVESNVSRRLIDLGDEIKLCIELEFDQNQRVRDEFARRRLDLEERAHAASLELKRLERRAKDAETDRDRYRRLYEQAQAVQMSRLLTRPTVFKKSKNGGPRTGRRAYSVGVSLPSISRSGDDEDPIPSQSKFVATARKNKKHEDNEDDDYERRRVAGEDSTPEPPEHADGGDRRRYDDASESPQQQPQVAVHVQTRPHAKLTAHHDKPVYLDGVSSRGDATTPLQYQQHGAAVSPAGHQPSYGRHVEPYSSYEDGTPSDGVFRPGMQSPSSTQPQQQQRGLARVVRDAVQQERNKRPEERDQQPQVILLVCSFSTDRTTSAFQPSMC